MKKKKRIRRKGIKPLITLSPTKERKEI